MFRWLLLQEQELHLCLLVFALAGLSLQLFTEHKIEVDRAATTTELNAPCYGSRMNSEFPEDDRALLRCWSGKVLQELPEVLAIKHVWEDEAADGGISHHKTEKILEIRTQVHDAPNLGGVHEPTLPRLCDVTEQVRMRQAQRALANRRTYESESEAQRFDILRTPSLNQNILCLNHGV